MGEVRKSRGKVGNEARKMKNRVEISFRWIKLDK